MSTEKCSAETGLRRFPAGSNVLVLGDGAAAGDGICGDLLTNDVASDVLVVEHARDLATCRDRLTEIESGGEKRLLGVGTVGGTPGCETTGVSVDSLSNPADLTGLGIEVSRFLDRSRRRDAETKICVRSLTALLQFTDLRRTFRFLHVLAGRVEAAGAVAHYHLDPDAHDDQTVGSLTSLFDAAVEPDGGQWTARRRE